MEMVTMIVMVEVMVAEQWRWQRRRWRMTRKFLREMLLDAKKQHLKAWEDAARLQEARSKEQQIRGQQAMLDQKIKAEYDKLTKDVPPPSERKKKK